MGPTRSLLLVLVLLVVTFSDPLSDIEPGPSSTVYISVVVSVISVLAALLGLVGCFIVAFLIWRCRKHNRAVTTPLLAVAEGGQYSYANLTLRDPFIQSHSQLPTRAYRVGFWTYTPEQKRVQLLDTAYIFRNKLIVPRVDQDRKFSDIFYNLRCGKYTAYSHCKFCYLEQREFYKKHGQTCCVKCGLPTILYIDFEPEDRFCVLCALLNKYHPRPHIRCLLHPSGKGRRLGAMYVLFKEYFSISSASKPKKRTPRAQKLQFMLSPQLWKLNSAIRFDYLWLLRRLIRLDLKSPHKFDVSMGALEETKREVSRRLGEVGPHMPINFSEHGLELDLLDGSISDLNKRKYFSSMKQLLQQLLRCIQQHMNYLIMQKGAEETEGLSGLLPVLPLPAPGTGTGGGVVGRKRVRLDDQDQVQSQRGVVVGSVYDAASAADDDDDDDDAMYVDSETDDDDRPRRRATRRPRRRAARAHAAQRNKRRRKNDGTYVELNVNINVQGGGPEPPSPQVSEDSIPSVGTASSSGAGPVQMHPMDIQVAFLPPGAGVMGHPHPHQHAFPPGFFPPPPGTVGVGPLPLVNPHLLAQLAAQVQNDPRFGGPGALPLPPPLPTPPSGGGGVSLPLFPLDDVEMFGMDEECEAETERRTSPSGSATTGASPPTHDLLNDPTMQMQMGVPGFRSQQAPLPVPPPLPQAFRDQLLPPMVPSQQQKAAGGMMMPRDSSPFLRPGTTSSGAMGTGTGSFGFGLSDLSGTSSSALSGVVDFSKSFDREISLYEKPSVQRPHEGDDPTAAFDSDALAGDGAATLSPQYDVDDYLRSFDADCISVDGLVASAVNTPLGHQKARLGSVSFGARKRKKPKQEMVDVSPGIPRDDHF